MFEFWFNPATSFSKKLLMVLITLAITLFLFTKQPLPYDAILMFAGTGLIFLICRYIKNIIEKKNAARLLNRLLTWIPIALIVALLFSKALNNLLVLGLQGLGFLTLSVFLFSPFAGLGKTATES
ncbi:MAG: hypothetical protein QM666_04690 [Acinetobacter sp.]